MEIVQLKPKKIISIRTRCSLEELPKFLTDAFKELGRYSRRNLVIPAGKPFVIYHSEEKTPMDVEVGFPVFRQGKGSEAAKKGVLPEGIYATTRHFGPYATMQESYKQLEEYIRDSEYTKTGLSIEVFRTNPGFTPPARLKTDIYFQVERSEPEA